MDLGGYDWAAWLGLAVVLGLVELASLDLVLLMLAGGAIAAAVVALTPLGVVAQAVVGLLVAVALLVVVRPVALRHLRSTPETRTGVAALVGRRAVVLEQVDDHAGTVRLAGEVWSARPYAEGLVIAPGAPVDVLKIEGATALVHPVEALP